MKYREIMRAEMSPDVYGGRNCDEVRPRWECTAEGDMDSEYLGTLELDSRHFPPGTKIVVMEPECPDCEEIPEICSCGFNWGEWVENKYS